MSSLRSSIMLALLVICFLPLTIFALPVTDTISAAVSGPIDPANYRIKSARGDPAHDPDGRISCTQPGRPDVCTVRVTQFGTDHHANINLFGSQCENLQNPFDSNWSLGTDAVLFSALPWAVLLTFKNDWHNTPTGKYAGYDFGGTIGDCITHENTMTRSCLLRFPC